MSAVNILRNLQGRQREHDIRAHQDIYYLPYPDRIKHLTFHVSKYAGRLAKGDLTDTEFNRTLVDTFVITLSAAEVLRIDFAEVLSGWTNVAEHATLTSLGVALEEQDSRMDDSLQDWYFRKLAYVGGRMSKACESLDHMEAIPYRDILREAVIDLCHATLVVSATLSLDLITAVGQRWEEIELHRIF